MSLSPRTFSDDGTNVKLERLDTAHLRKLAEIQANDFRGRSVRFFRNVQGWKPVVTFDDDHSAHRIASSVRTIAQKLLKERGRR